MPPGVCTVFENPIFSKRMGFGVTNHHSMVSGGEGRGARTFGGGGSLGESSYKDVTLRVGTQREHDINRRPRAHLHCGSLDELGDSRK